MKSILVNLESYFHDFFITDNLSKDAISCLPQNRQRNSLLAVGKNLLNIPDEEPEPRIIRSTSSSDLAKPLKKRLIMGLNNFENENINSINTNINGINTLKRPASLMELSDACEVERTKIRRPSPRGPNAASLIRISPQNGVRRSHIISPINASGMTLLRKPLSPLTSLNVLRNSTGSTAQNGPQSYKPPQIQTSNFGSKTVISIMPPVINNSIMDLSKRKY